MQHRGFFFFIIFVVFVLIDLYAWQGAKVLMQDSSTRWQKTVRLIWWGFTAGTLLMFLFLSLDRSFGKWHTFLTFYQGLIISVLLAKLFFAAFVLFSDATRLIQYLISLFTENSQPTTVDETEKGISRNSFLLQSGALVSGAVFTGLQYGIIKSAHDYRVINQTIALSNLPIEFDGFRILQISDIHSGSFWDKRAVERGVSMAMHEQADAVFFTGDLVNNKANEMDHWMGVFENIQSKEGVFSILGNHDYGDYISWESAEHKQKNLDLLVKRHADLGWDLLRNEHRTIERNGKKLEIIGIENWSNKAHFPRHGRLDLASQATENSDVRLLLSHDPSHWRGQVLQDFSNIDITFSGHTHGAQMGIETGNFKFSPVSMMYPEWAGHYTQNNQHLYVNRGFGYIGYPGRFGIRPELTIITLKKAV